MAMKADILTELFTVFPPRKKMGRVKDFECRKDLLDKYGIEYDEIRFTHLEDLSEIFATVQAGEGDASTVSQQTEVRIRFIPTSITPISWEPAMHPAF